MLVAKREASMTGILNKFHVEHDIYGARVLARTHELTAHCTEDSEVDGAIQLLKEDLDACAREMKRLIKLNRGPLFEGWPSPKDDVLDA